MQMLMALVASGWRYQHCEPHEVRQETGWRQFWLDAPDGSRHAVSPRIAVTAWRKGLAKPETACS